MQHAMSTKDMFAGASGRLAMPRVATATFDASDPVHLVVASAAPRLFPGSQAGRAESYWDGYEENIMHLQLDR